MGVRDSEISGAKSWEKGDSEIDGAGGMEVSGDKCGQRIKREIKGKIR